MLALTLPTVPLRFADVSGEGDRVDDPGGDGQVGWQQPVRRRIPRVATVVALLALVLVVGALARVDGPSDRADTDLQVRRDDRGPPVRRPARPAPEPALPVLTGEWTAVKGVPQRDVEPVWADERLVLWGGQAWSSAGGAERRTFFGDGATYEPDADRWRPLAAAPLAPRAGHATVWTGEELLVWGGEGPAGFFGDGAAYDPHTDRWRMLAVAPLPPRAGATAVWTGEEVLVGGGRDHTGPLGELAAYDPVDDEWRRLPDLTHPFEGAGRHGVDGLWDGSTAVFWQRSVDGAVLPEVVRFDPRTETWWQLPAPPMPARSGVLAVAWTGEALLAVARSHDRPPRTSAAVLSADAEDWQEIRPAEAAGEGVHTEFGSVAWAPQGLYVAAGHDVGLLDVEARRWHRLPEWSLPLTASWRWAVWAGDGLIAVSQSDEHAGAQVSAALWRPDER